MKRAVQVRVEQPAIKDLDPEVGREIRRLADRIRQHEAGTRKIVGAMTDEPGVVIVDSSYSGPLTFRVNVHLVKGRVASATITRTLI